MKIGALEIELLANVARLQKDMEDAKRHVSGAMGQIQKTVDMAKVAFGALAGVLSVGAFAGMIKGAIDGADALNDLSVRTKIAVADLAGLRYAAKMTDTDLDGTAKAVNKLMVEMGKAPEKFTALGITARDPIEAFKQLADIFKAIEDPQLRAALGAQVLGKSWEAAAPMLQEGSAGIEALIARGKELDPVTSEMAEQAAILNDRYDELQFSVTGLQNSLAMDMLPGLVNTTSAIKEAYEESGKLSAAWTALGALGSFLFTDEFDSATVKIKNLREELEGVEQDLSLSKNAPYVGWLGRMLFGETTEVLEEKVRSLRAQIKALQSEATPKPAAFEDPFGDAFMKAVEAYGGARDRVEQFLANRAQAESDRAKREYADRVKGAQDYVAALARERSEIGATSEQIKMMGAAREAAKAPTAALRQKIMEEALALNVATKAWGEKTKAEALAAAGIEDAHRQVNAINEQTRALQEKVAQYGLLPDAITAVKIAELEAESQSLVLSEAGLAAIRAKIDALKELKKAQSASQLQDESTKAAAEHARAWKLANDQIGQSLTDAIMRGGKSAGEYLKDYFRTLTLRPVIQALMAPVSGAMTAMLPGYANAATSDGGSSLMSMAGAGQSIYSAITGGFANLSTAVADSVQGMMYQSGMTTQIASNGAFANAAGTAAGYLGGAAIGVYGGRAISNGYSVIGNSGNTAVNAGTIIGAFFGGPIGAAIGGLIGGLANRAFGHRPKEVTGTTLNGHFGMAGNFTGGIDNSWMQKGGWFRSDKTGVDRIPVEAEMVAAFTQGYGALKTATAEYAKALGLNADAIANRVQSMSITLTKDEEKNKQLIADFFSGVGDTMAREVLPMVDTLKVAGETAGGTLQRLARNYLAVDEVLRALGMTFGATGVASLEARERLINLSGGIEKLAANAGVFAQEFLTEAERLAPVQAMVVAEMAKLGLVSVDTRDEFKAVVMGLDLTTEAGAKQYAALMSLAGAFAQVHPVIEATTQAATDNAAILNERARLQDQLDQLTMTGAQLREKERSALDESNRAILDRINAINDEKAAIEAAHSFASGLLGDVDAAYSTLQTVVGSDKARVTDLHNAGMKLLQGQLDLQNEVIGKHKALSSLLSGALDSARIKGGESADRLAAQAQIRTALAIAKAGGVLPDADSLRKSLGVVGQDASSMFATYADYARDFYTTQNDIAALGKLTDDALTVEQKALNEMLAQKKLAQEMYEAEMKRLDTILSNAAEQVAVLKGQSTTLLSIDQALQAFLGTLGAALNNPLAAGAGAITSTYQSALGRTPDAAGMAFWQEKLGQGVSQADIDAAIRNSPEARAQKMYQQIFGRAGDAGGIKFWTDQMASGVSDSAIVAAMLGSPEKKRLLGIPGYELGGMFGGGLRIVGERGPELEATGPARIWNASQTRSMLDGGENSALIAAVEKLTRTVELQASELADIKRNTRRQADQFEQVTEGGNGMRTVPA